MPQDCEDWVTTAMTKTRPLPRHLALKTYALRRLRLCDTSIADVTKGGGCDNRTTVRLVRKAASRNFAQVTGGTPEADWEPSVRWRTLEYCRRPIHQKRASNRLKAVQVMRFRLELTSPLNSMWYFRDLCRFFPARFPAPPMQCIEEP
jgi:hypothetical protein